MLNNKIIMSKIEKIIESHDIVLFMKGTKEQPRCGFSDIVIKILQIFSVDYYCVNVLDDLEMRQAIKIFTDWPTIPQLYIKQEFIGGSDIIKELYENGELKKKLNV